MPEHALRISGLVVVRARAVNDAQSAFKWGMGDYLKNRQLLNDVCAGIESLRNSMD